MRDTKQSKKTEICYLVLLFIITIISMFVLNLIDLTKNDNEEIAIYNQENNAEDYGKK